MNNRPIDLTTALSSFETPWSPRIVTRVNDYDVRVAKLHGEFVWHTHDDTDEFFLCLDGEMDIALREPSGEHTVHLTRGSVFVVPKGIEHKPLSPGGASALLFEPTGTPTTGDHHETLAALVKGIETTTGYELQS